MITRQAAREWVAQPGKFEGESPMVPILWECFMMGFADEDNGELVRIGRWTLYERSDGFVIGERHATEADAISAMVLECICPLVWCGHGEAKPDPKRIDPECPIHAQDPC